MKCAKKIISVALVLMLALSVLVIPTSAAEPDIVIDVVATYQGQTSGGYDYYKFSVYLDSTLTLTGYQMSITWDNNVWQVLRATNYADQGALIANMVIDQKDPENILYTACDAYQNYGGGSWDYPGSPNGYTLMPGDGTAPGLAKISDDLLGAELKAAGYTGLYNTWAADQTDDYLLLSGGTLNGLNSPTSGRQMVLSWYMRLKDGVEDGTYEVGLNAKQLARLTGTYEADDVVAAINGGNLKEIPPERVTYNNAFVQIGDVAESSIVTEKGAQIRYTKTAEGDFANVYDVRTRATIAAADVTATFGTTDAAALETAITSVGFVYAPAGTAFDTAAAQAAAKAGSSSGGYTVAPVNYIQQEADGSLMFTCLVTGINTNQTGTGLQTYAYICVNGEYYFYDAVTTVSYNELFTNNWASAAGAYSWDSSVPSLG